MYGSFASSRFPLTLGEDALPDLGGISPLVPADVAKKNHRL